MERKALYAGSFDPPTLGHFHMIEEGLKLFDKIIVAIGVNPNKRDYFAPAQRMSMIDEWIHTHDLWDRVEVIFYFKQLTADVAEEHGSMFMLRGIRNAKDYDYEMEIKEFNDKYNPRVQTVFLTPKEGFAGISSSVVRGLVGLANWETAVKDYAPENVIEYLKKKLEQDTITCTG